MFFVTTLLFKATRRAELSRVTICEAVSLNASPASVIPTGFVDRSSSVPAPSQISSACMCLLSADCVKKRVRAASVKLRVSHTARKSSNHLRFIEVSLVSRTLPRARKRTYVTQPQREAGMETTLESNASGWAASMTVSDAPRALSAPA